MNDHDALLRAICENPREDTPRLVYADWLEENGEPERAAFIRTDIEMSLRDEWDAERLKWAEAKHNHPGADPERAGRLPVDTHRAGVGFELLPVLRRGFPSTSTVRDLGRFRWHARELFAGHPVESLAFGSVLPQLDWFVAEPWFPRVAGLEWAAGRYSPQKLRPLLDRPDAGLAELTVRELALAPDGLRAVFEHPLLARLTGLKFLGATPQVARSVPELFARPPAACALRSLTIHGDGINRDLLLLARSLPESLRVLDLSSTRINSAQVREFAGAGAVSGLRMLTLSSNALGNDGGAALFTSPHLAGLKVLRLQYCQIGDDAVRALLDNSPLADGLNLLDLTGSPASGDMKEAVKARMGDRVRV